ncbi:MAG TPA: hypothetical protein DCY74_05360, partial [Clostridiales bacterium]|nr:hypothetical protein [Clostridiales bacterium]
MVYRIYVEKKSGPAHEIQGLLHDLRAIPGLESLESLRILNRYDVENISEELFARAIGTVFSEPQLDYVYTDLPAGKAMFAVEYLPV